MKSHFFKCLVFMQHELLKTNLTNYKKFLIENILKPYYFTEIRRRLFLKIRFNIWKLKVIFYARLTFLPCLFSPLDRISTLFSCCKVDRKEMEKQLKQVFVV